MNASPRARMRLAISIALGLVISLTAAAALAVVGSDDPVARSSARPAPRLASPADDVRVRTVPAFSWRKVRRAAEYEFQLAADRAFESIVNRGTVTTRNTHATLNETLADGRYYWRVRALDSRGRGGRWSVVRELRKAWDDRPQLLGPGEGSTVVYPQTPLVLRWSHVPYAYKYLVRIATDPALANSVLTGGEDVETSGTSFALPNSLPAGRYYWAITPLDSQMHRGARSAVGSFEWSWPTGTATRVAELNSAARVTPPVLADPQVSWDAVPGAADYEVEINPSVDFAPGSKVCCTTRVTGTSVSPTKVLPNNTYYWRVRALDVDGNAGEWNHGPSFRKDFDTHTPTVPGLRLHAHSAATGSPTPVTSTPVIDWDPVPGASSYNVVVAEHDPGLGCKWTSSSAFDVVTATTAWTPLSPRVGADSPVGLAYPRVSRDIASLEDGVSYCFRVRARSDRDVNNGEVVSAWTHLTTSDTPAFTYDEAAVGSPGPQGIRAVAGNYGLPAAGSSTTSMPLFTWQPVPGAGSYFVVVAKDQAFTEVLDVALTRVPAYAPRQGVQPHTYPDETTTYYWAIVPAAGNGGEDAPYDPTENAYQPFQKQSVPPTLLAPASGADIAAQPTFHWTSQEGARSYRLQVAQEPTFGNPIDDIVTSSTAYTSTASYPADSVLYWRVRVTDEDLIGLNWSATGSFVRRLPVPQPDAGNPQGGETIPVLAWTPVQGAVSYEMHVDQSDGTTRDFTLRSSAFTPVTFYGTGVWHYQVRANFRSGSQTVSGGYFSPTPFTRRIGTPPAARAHRSNGGVVLSWEPSPMVRRYRVELSETNSFRRLVESATTDNTTYAPRLARRNVRLSRLYWRVAALDQGNNLGGWSGGRVVPARPMRVTVSGGLSRRGRRVVQVKVTSRGRPVRSASVKVTGVARARPRRTNRRGVARFELRPSRAGRVVFRAVKRGYEPARRTVRVR